MTEKESLGKRETEESLLNMTKVSTISSTRYTLQGKVESFSDGEEMKGVTLGSSLNTELEDFLARSFSTKEHRRIRP